MQRGGQHRGQRARLAGDAYRPRAFRRGLHVGFDEGQRHPFDIVGAAEAIRPFDNHAVLGGDAPEFELFAHAFFAASEKPAE